MLQQITVMAACWIGYLGYITITVHVATDYGDGCVLDRLLRLSYYHGSCCNRLRWWLRAGSVTSVILLSRFMLQHITVMAGCWIGYFGYLTITVHVATDYGDGSVLDRLLRLYYYHGSCCNRLRWWLRVGSVTWVILLSRFMLQQITVMAACWIGYFGYITITVHVATDYGDGCVLDRLLGLYYYHGSCCNRLRWWLHVGSVTSVILLSRFMLQQITVMAPCWIGYLGYLILSRFMLQQITVMAACWIGYLGYLTITVHVATDYGDGSVLDRLLRLSYYHGSCCNRLRWWLHVGSVTWVILLSRFMLQQITVMAACWIGYLGYLTITVHVATDYGDGCMLDRLLGLSYYHGSCCNRLRWWRRVGSVSSVSWHPSALITFGWSCYEDLWASASVAPSSRKSVFLFVYTSSATSDTASAEQAAKHIRMNHPWSSLTDGGL